MQQLFFVRHGESEFNAERLYAGQTDTPLTVRGREQAHKAAMKAPALNIDLIVSSPLNRALETAQIIADSIGYPTNQIDVQDIFLEISYGSLEGKSWDTPNLERFTDIETDEHLTDRAAQGLAYLQSLNVETVLLVGHGSYARSLMRLIGGPSLDHGEPENATIIKLI